MKAYPGQSGTGLVLYDAWAVPGVITDMCCLLKFTVHHPQPTDRPVLGHRPDRVSPGGYLHPGWGCTRAITRPCTARALCSIGGEACGVTLTVRSRSHYLGLLSHHLHRATIYSGEFRRENLWSDCHVASSRAPWPHCTLLVQACAPVAHCIARQARAALSMRTLATLHLPEHRGRIARCSCR